MMPHGCGRPADSRPEGIFSRLQPQRAYSYTVKVRLRWLDKAVSRPPQQGISKRHDLALRSWHSPAVPFRTSGTTVEAILETPDSNPNIMHIGRVSDEVQVGVRQ